MAARTSEFQTVRSEGGLLPPDLLRRVLDPKERLVGAAAADYGLPEGERLNEVITQSWNRLRKHWQEFRAGAAKLPQTETGTSLTNDKWTLPLLRELGYHLYRVFEFATAPRLYVLHGSPSERCRLEATQYRARP